MNNIKERAAAQSLDNYDCIALSAELLSAVKARFASPDLPISADTWALMQLIEDVNDKALLQAYELGKASKKA